MYAQLALAAIQAVGGFQQADIIRQNGDLQAGVQEMNKQFADVDAFNAVKAGYSDAARYQSVIDQTQSKVRGAYASEGVSVGYGTAGDVEKDNHIAGLINTLQIQRHAQDTAVGYKTQSLNLQMGANMTRLQAGLSASAAESSGIMKAAGSVVTGYQMDNLTGRGRDKDSGTSDQAWKSKEKTIHAKDDGGSVAPPHMYDNGYGWFPNKHDPGGPGFFGTEEGYNKAVGSWRSMSAMGDSYYGYGRDNSVGG